MWGGTLKASLDHVEGMDCQSGDGAGGEAGDGFNERGREALMVGGHREGKVGSCCGVRERRVDDRIEA